MRSPLADVSLLFPDDCPPGELAIIVRVAHLRTLPEGATPWKEIEFEVCLTKRILTRYVWVLAAVLRARDLKWGEIAAHPWVEGKLKEAVLRNKHTKRKLPTGQQFDGFVEWYKAELAARFTEVLAEQAKSDAVSVRDLCLQILTSCVKTQRKIDAGQQLLKFDDSVEMSKGELELEQTRVLIRKNNTAALEQVNKLLRLSTASPTEITATPDEARDAVTGDEGTVDERTARIRTKLAELDKLKEGAALMDAPAVTRDPLHAEYDVIEADLDALLHQARIERYGSNPFMRWILTYGQHDMAHQDGPNKGRFVAPAPCHHIITADLYRKLTGGAVQPRYCGVLSRDMAKTTIATKWLTLFAVAVHGKRNVVLVCVSKKEAKGRIDAIIGELETNQQLLTDYPELTFAKDSKSQWIRNTDYEITLANGATIAAYEFGASMRGRNIRSARIDLAILDDPENENHEYSELKRERAWHWLQAVLLKGMTTHALLCWLATPVGGNALLLRARRSPDDVDEPGLGWDGPLVPIAVEFDAAGVEIPWTETPPQIPWAPTPPSVIEQIREHDPDDAARIVAEELVKATRWYQPTWSARWNSLEVAWKLNEGDQQIAQQELMGRPVSRTASPFDIAWFDDHGYNPALLKRVSAGVFTYDNVRLSRPRAHIDSASSTAPGADFTAIPVGAQHPVTKKILLIGMYYGRIEVPEQLDTLQEFYEYYGLGLITYQPQHLETTLQQFAKRTHALPLEPVKVNTSAGAKDRRIRGSAVHYRNANVLFNVNDEMQRWIRTEMKHYPAKHDDALDAVEELLAGFLSGNARDGDASQASVLQSSVAESSGMEAW